MTQFTSRIEHGPFHRLCAVMAILFVVGLFVGTSGLWPWDHDEVASFAELGLVSPLQYPEPVSQVQRMQSLVPVWYVLQNAALAVVARSEWGARLLPSASGALAVIAAFLFALRAGGRWFAWSLLLMLVGSQSLLWLSQQNRFYPLALLWTTLALICIWSSEGWWRDVGAAAFTALAVLTHNITVVFFCLGAAAAVPCMLLDRMPRAAGRRAILSGAVAAGIYLLYLRPLITGWISGGTGGTQPLVSMIAQVGIVPVALAVFAGVALVSRPDREQPSFDWWLVVLVSCIAFVAVSPWLVGNWNPRYALFFMIPVWVMAAQGCASITKALGSARVAGAWLLCVAIMLTPKLASHFVDGSRHDLRSAAAIIAERAPDIPVFCNWPAELQYYLEPLTGQHAGFWSSPGGLPDGPSVVVIASNAWEPVLSSPSRRVTVLGEVGKRRLDEQSHWVRVYLVSAPDSVVPAMAVPPRVDPQ